MHQPGDAVRDDEPSRDARGGSVVLDGDRSASNGVYARAAADVGALFGLGRPYDPASEPLPVQPFGAGDAMRWSPPPDGEDTPPCPA